MSKRSELRRIHKKAEKSEKKQKLATTSSMPLKVLYGSQEQVQKDFGLSVQELKLYLERMEKEMKKDFSNEYEEKLNKAEEYISVANLLIAIYALKMSRKKREHTKDLIQRMIENFNSATEFVKRVGIKEAYDMAHKDLDITIEFDAKRVNEEFGFPGDVL